MTREEALQAWEQMRSEIDNENWLFVGTINPQMVDIAIEALKREPQGDLISRAEAIEALKSESIFTADRPRGEWVEETSWKYKKGGRNSDMKEILGTEWMTMIRQRCSECNMVTMVDDSILYKYCPHCGAVMRSE